MLLYHSLRQDTGGKVVFFNSTMNRIVSCEGVETGFLKFEMKAKSLVLQKLINVDR